MNTPILQTEKLTLKPLVLNDTNWIQCQFNDWDIIGKMFNAPWPYPENGAEEHLINTVLPQLKNKQAFHWGIFKKTNLINGIGVLSFRYNLENVKEHRGFWIGKKEQNNGYITEACFALNELIFGDMNWTSYIAENFKDNIASKRIKEKTGGVLINSYTQNVRGEDRKTETWEIRKKNWEILKNKQA